jgi:hypothetical protein
VIQGATAFIAPLSTALWIGGAPTGSSDVTPVVLDEECRMCLEEWNTIFTSPMSSWCVKWLLPSTQTVHVCQTDAAGVLSKNMLSCGWAIAFNGPVIKGDFRSPKIKSDIVSCRLNMEDMTWKEIYPVVVLCEMYGHLFSGSVVAVVVDNQAAAMELNKGRSKDKRRRPFLYRIARACRRYNFELVVDWRLRLHLAIPDHHTRA